MSRLLLFLCAMAALTFEGCQTVAGDAARQNGELARYLQDRWVMVGAAGAGSGEPAELFCRNGQWRSKGAGAGAAGRYVLKASTVCVTDAADHATTCRAFSKAPEGGYIAPSGSAVTPVNGASAFAISYACNALQP